MSSSGVTPITMQLIKEITGDFSKEKKLGSGGYGEVYKGVLNGHEVAVKMLFPVHGLDDEAFENEFANLMKVQHKNIVRLIGYCYEIAHRHHDHNGKFVFSRVIDRVLCFEYMHKGSLVKHISAESCIHDWPTTYKIIKGTCEGLHYLHKGRGENNYIYHMDLKPENILLDENLVPKIGDFGLSRLFGDSKTHQTSTMIGTIGFMPPEYISNRMMTPKNDVFSLGVIIFHIVAGEKGYNDYYDLRLRQVFLEKNLQEFIENVQEYWKKKMQSTTGYVSDVLGVTKCIEIAMSCVDTDRERRPTISEIIDDLNKLDAEIEEMSKKSPKPLVGQSLTTPNLSAPLGGCARKVPLDVVIVYAFDCTTSTPAWNKMEHEIFWLVQEKLTHFSDSFLGYTYVMSTPNTYTSDMKLVDSNEIKANGYTRSSAWIRTACAKNMASGLFEAHKLLSYRGHWNGIILLFSDGLINKGDFFDGAEDFVPKVPVHTFTLDGDAYNHVLRAIAANSPGGTFSPLPVPDKPSLSVPFSQLLDRMLNGTRKDDEKHPSPNSGRWPLDVVIVYAFDCTASTPSWYKVDDEVFWLVHEKLTHFVDSCLGYTYVMSTPNTYTSDMKLVDSNEIKANGYTRSSAWIRTTCRKNMASGLPVAHKLISDHGHLNGVILLFSDGLINRGDFFGGAEDFVSKVPVHTFTLGGDAYNHGLRTIADNSPGGTFSPLPVPEKPNLSVPFSRMLDSILSGTMKYDEKHPSPDSEWWPLDVVIVYAFDCTSSTPAWNKMDQEVFWLLQEKLTHFADSCLGYTYVMSTPNTYTSDMKLVDSAEVKANGYTRSSAWSRSTCMKNMASGLSEAHKLISYRGHWNSIILLFSDGLVNKGDFFDGAKDFVSKVPVHTFTLGGDAYNQVLRAMAANSPGGIFHPILIPDKPSLSVPFSQLLDSILSGTMKAS